MNVRDLLVSFIIIFSCTYLYSQSVKIYNVSSSGFPVMKAKFSAIDDKGNTLRNLSPSDITLKENGVIKQVTNITCPPVVPVQAVSLASRASRSVQTAIIPVLKLTARGSAWR